MKTSGSVLMVSVWVLSLLVLFAVGIGHRAAIELRMSSYGADRLNANYLARAGLNQAISLLRKDEIAHNTSGNPYDAFNEEWSSGIDSDGQRIFENITINPSVRRGTQEAFTVRYLYGADALGNKEYKCIQDEQGKINLNRLTSVSKDCLNALFTEAGVTNPNDLVDLTASWTNPVANSSVDPDNIFKRNFFKSPEELQLVLEYFYSTQEGVNASRKSWEVYRRVKDYITVYGDTPQVNINTASSYVLNCYINASARAAGITPTQELADAILRVRNDTMDNYFTSVDITSTSVVPRPIVDKFINKSIALDDTSLRILNESLFPEPKFNSSVIGVVSQDFRIEATANVNNVQKTVTAVYDRAAKEIVYWHEN